ncbi:MAG: 1-deoxy-D-xylulose-5-phosphate reductoisomerase [Spirosomataceae bacterium]
MSNLKKIAILGSTGSIGTQALEVIGQHPDRFEVSLLTAQNNADLLIEQAGQFRPEEVVIGNETLKDKVISALAPLGIRVYAGEDALIQIIGQSKAHTVLTALVGYSGLLPTLEAINTGKHIALANKETMVVAGELVATLATKRKVPIYPVDSEHSAIFQCLIGEEKNPIEKIILTASGGPFRGRKRDELVAVTKAQALRHPNWSMGAKITIDSATLMNKGLEVIEARWLFGLTSSQIEVVVHPQSIIHSMVQFQDGSIKAQMGLPDMRLPIQYALSYPERLTSEFPRFDFLQFPTFTFEAPDVDTFHCLSLAYQAMEKGGNLPCIVNAANEIAVAAFLEEKIGFLDIPEVIEKTIQRIAFIQNPTLQDYVDTDRETRVQALEIASNRICWT